MIIYKALGIDIYKAEMLSFVGGGGKTTTIFELAKEFISLNKKILISTTTRIFTPLKEEYTYLFLKDIDRDFNPLNGTITILGREIKNGKLEGISSEKLEEIFARNIFDIILIEADGSKRKPIKAPGNHEPVIPMTSTKTIGVIGLDSLGKAIDEDTVHRPELLRDIVGRNFIIDEEVIVKLVLDKNGLFKNASRDKILLLNKANDEMKICKAKRIRRILDDKHFNNVAIADIKEKKFY
ncbi:putative selenium-dependent hydroxylase accessory protein YqeC [Tissierella carlieri]|uniref:Selenium cofactor biosynthesis protein YqeC n=1 Tax=Tissierella carlieri TaxID=689904 RepID=A0ABT1SH53_9FIRM|nr:selenium cofactor biosynthesis protein YqeC [Tissierella carlieri]MBU5312746.1 putative selenium-dependent hydroxylase accessory protein YqeC [Tissierella carlieri]MCQ4925819.1 selenium cofactor biosynthesis protein YqeC [Tissierella carlieri]MDU5083285.1 selenium cofactor biosynthesis protein YqeC [Bacillota bacterium]